MKYSDMLNEKQRIGKRMAEIESDRLFPYCMFLADEEAHDRLIKEYTELEKQFYNE